MTFSFSKVILTRQAHKSENLAKLLGDQNIPNQRWPLIQIDFLSLKPYQDLLTKAQKEKPHLLFPSANAVHGFFQGAKEIGISTEEWSSFKTSVVGKATAETLKEYGPFHPVIPKPSNAVSLIETLKRTRETESFLLIAGAQSSLISLLEQENFTFDFLPCYQTIPVPAESREQIEIEKALFLFASPSAVKSYLLTHSFAGVFAVIAIGNTTAKEVRIHFSGRLLTAREPSDLGLLECISKLIA